MSAPTAADAARLALQTTRFAGRHPAVSNTLRHLGADVVDRPADGGQGDTVEDDGSPLQIRVVGSPHDVADAVAALRLALPVNHVSQPFAGRGGQVRVYLHSDVPPPPGECE